MPDRAPFFSIVIPTTRPHLLRYSLASALAQTFSDFEVVVSHNTNPGAPALDWLPSDTRIRYIRPASFLPQHEHWDFALRQARGRWQLLLGDDDAIVPSLLSIAAEAAERFPSIPIISWTWCSFVDQQWPEARTAGLASVPPYTAGLEVTACNDYLDCLFRMNPRKMPLMKRFLPSIMRGMYRSDLARIARENFGGQLCGEWTPDYSAVAHVLPFTREMLLIDMPLLTFGTTRDSMAAIYAGESDVYAQNFERAGRPRYRHIPVQSKAHSRPLIAETLMIAREMRPQQLGHLDFDLVSFLNWHYAGLMEMKALGRDVVQDEAEFRHVLDTLDGDRRLRLERLITDQGLDRQDAASVPFLRRASRALARRALTLTSGRRSPADALVSRAIKNYGTSFIYPKGSVSDISKFVSWLGPLLGHADWSKITATPRELLLSDA